MALLCMEQTSSSLEGTITQARILTQSGKSRHSTLMGSGPFMTRAPVSLLQVITTPLQRAKMISMCTSLVDSERQVSYRANSCATTLLPSKSKRLLAFRKGSVRHRSFMTAVITFTCLGGLHHRASHLRHCTSIQL